MDVGQFHRTGSVEIGMRVMCPWCRPQKFELAITLLARAGEKQAGGRGACWWGGYGRAVCGTRSAAVDFRWWDFLPLAPHKPMRSS